MDSVTPQDDVREVELSQRLNPDLTNRRQMQEIIPRVFLGPFGSATKANFTRLKEVGITHIVCIRHEMEARLVRPIFPEEFTYLVLDIADHSNQPIIPFFAQFRQFVDTCLQSGGKVLVHGSSGASRSASLLASYIMQTHLCTAGEAIKLIQAKRFCIFPNEGFRRQLYEYEPILRAKLGVPGSLERPEKRKERDEGGDEEPCDVDS